MLTEILLTKEKIKQLSDLIPNLEEELELLFKKGIDAGYDKGYKDGYQKYERETCGKGLKCPFYRTPGIL